MYESFFGLKEAPFSIAPNPHYLYMSKQHNEALAHLVYGVANAGGFVLLTGEVGTGKTTICRCFLEQVPEDTDVAFILNPKLSVEELLEAICDELSISYIGDKMTAKTYVDYINERLLRSHSKGRHTVLIIDEAQTMEPDVLEQLRLLTNLETHEKKLLQIVLLGQPELQELFCRNELRQLAQRVTARFHLDALKPEEISAYVIHRLGVAGVTDPTAIFPPATMRTIYQISKGIPRVINLICDRAMLGAYSESSRTVTPNIMRKAAQEVLGRTNPELVQKSWWDRLLQKKWVSALGLATVCGLSAGIGVGVVNSFMNNSDTPVVQQAEASSQAEAKPVQNKAKSVQTAQQKSKAAPAQKKVAQKAKPVSSRAAEKKTPAKASQADKNLALINHDKEPDNDLDQADSLVTSSSTDADLVGLSTEEVFTRFATEMTQASGHQALMKVWGVEYVQQRDGSVCAMAKVYGLACLNKIGSLGSLKHMGLPAVLTLFSKQGERFYGFLRSMDNNTVSFVVGAQQVTLPLSELDKIWRGHYLVLWKVPSTYRGPLKPNTIGPMTKWLSAQLDAYEGKPNPESPRAFYDPKMVKRVKNFQKDVGEVADGVVGINTLIQLSKFNDTDVPKLLRSEQERL